MSSILPHGQNLEFSKIVFFVANIIFFQSRGQNLGKVEGEEVGADFFIKVYLKLTILYLFHIS